MAALSICGQRAADGFQERFDNLTPVYLPTHASWMNQIEIYLSILQRKALTPAHFTSPRKQSPSASSASSSTMSESHSPFDGKFIRCDLSRLLAGSPIPAIPQYSLAQAAVSDVAGVDAPAFVRWGAHPGRV